MGQSSKTEEEQSGGCPEWMVTFCDCMTLLLTFFVLLLSLASFHKETLPQLGQSFAQALPSIGLSPSERKSSIWQKMSSEDPVKQNEGSETPTASKQQTGNFMREKRALDFRNLKVFTVSSESFFFGRGAALSNQGREVLDALAIFFEHQTGRVVISENGPEGNTELGLNRAAAVMDYLIKRGLDKKRFSVTASTMMRDKNDRRQLEITLLDRSIYE
jgi:chemotaxis protein MotB